MKLLLVTLKKMKNSYLGNRALHVKLVSLTFPKNIRIMQLNFFKKKKYKSLRAKSPFDLEKSISIGKLHFNWKSPFQLEKFISIGKVDFNWKSSLESKNSIWKSPFRLEKSI